MCFIFTYLVARMKVVCVLANNEASHTKIDSGLSLMKELFETSPYLVHLASDSECQWAETIAIIYSIKSFGICPLPSTVNERQGRSDGELVSGSAHKTTQMHYCFACWVGRAGWGTLRLVHHQVHIACDWWHTAVGGIQSGFWTK